MIIILLLIIIGVHAYTYTCTCTYTYTYTYTHTHTHTYIYIYIHTYIHIHLLLPLLLLLLLLLLRLLLLLIMMLMIMIIATSCRGQRDAGSILSLKRYHWDSETRLNESAIRRNCLRLTFSPKFLVGGGDNDNNDKIPLGYEGGKGEQNRERSRCLKSCAQRTS